MTYEAYMDGSTETLEADTISEAMDLAADWARDGDYGALDGTIWLHVSVKSEDGTEQESETVAIDPDEPECSDGEHDWQSPHEIVGGIEENPGVWGHGGGVTISECCMKCGCRKFTDTWAQNPENGQQGLESVSYDPGYYAEKYAEQP